MEISFKKYLEESVVLKGLRFVFRGNKIPVFDIEKNKWSIVTANKKVDNLPSGIRLHLSTQGAMLVFPHEPLRGSGLESEVAYFKDVKTAIGADKIGRIFQRLYREAAREDLIRKSTIRLKRKNAARVPNVRNKKIEIDIDRIIHPTDQDVIDEVHDITRYNADSFRK